MIEITDKQLDTFREIVERFHATTQFPKPNNWKQLSNNEIWLHIVAQVMIVGSSRPYEKLNKDEELKKKISYESLSKIENNDELKKTISHVLRTVGTRYARSNPNKCLKTQALFHNFRQVSKEAGGPLGFMNKIPHFQEDEDRIQFVIKSFKFIKNKGARDLLMELGIVKDAIALDVRLRNILGKIGIEYPKDFSNPRVYDQVESDILFKVCKPLGISGVELDRILYQNYTEIMNNTYSRN